MKRISTPDTNGDGRPDISIDASVRKGNVDRDYESACKKWLAYFDEEKPDPSKKPANPVTGLNAAKPISLIYVSKSDGTFEPTDATKKATAELYHDVDTFLAAP